MRNWLPSLPWWHPGKIRPAHVTRDQLVLAAKTAIAAGIAWAAALAANPHSKPYFAPLAVLLVVQPTVYDSLSRAFQRVLGVIVGVAAALAVSHVLVPSAWSISIIIFAGLLVGRLAHLGPLGVVQVPVSAMLVFLVGQTTPGYAGERIVDTLIGAGVAVIAVLLSPSAPPLDAVMSQAVAPLLGCADILRAISAGLASGWTPEQADAWRRDAGTLMDSVATARSRHDGVVLSTRWNARAGRQRAALGQAAEALGSGGRIAIYTRSMTRALADGSEHAHPMPALSAMLASTAAATEAYATWLASADPAADRQPLADAVHAADDTLAQAFLRAEQRWGSDPAPWLTFGTTLAMTQRILAEVGRSIDSAAQDPA